MKNKTGHSHTEYSLPFGKDHGSETSTALFHRNYEERVHTKWSDVKTTRRRRRKNNRNEFHVLCRIWWGCEWVSEWVRHVGCEYVYTIWNFNASKILCTKNKLLGCLNWKFIARAPLNFFSLFTSPLLANVACTALEFLAFVVWCWNKCWVLLFKRNRYCFGRLLPIQFEQMPENRARAPHQKKREWKKWSWNEEKNTQINSDCCRGVKRNNGWRNRSFGKKETRKRDKENSAGF